MNNSKISKGLIAKWPKTNPPWLILLPSFIRRKIEHRPNVQKIFVNTGWLFGDNILRMGVGLFVSVWVAKYLGPVQYGLFNYAVAFVSLFISIANLGLQSIVVRDVLQDPPTVRTTMGTAFVLSILGGISTWCFALIAISYARPHDEMAKFIVCLLSPIMVFKSTDVIRYWFESQVQYKYVVWLENGIFLALSVLKIILILASAPLIAFVWVMFSESLTVAVGLIGIYSWHGGKITTWRFKLHRAKNLLKDSWPIVLSSFAIMVYMRIDQIMLGQMLGDQAVGIYTASVKISEVWYFIPMAIIASVYPSIIESKKRDEIQYYRRLQKLYDFMLLLAFAVAVPMTFLSSWIIPLFFGNAYQQSSNVLAIQIWAGIFVFLGVASTKWFIIEGLQKYTFYRTLLGAFINIGLNLFLIPGFGVIGAAWATVFSQAGASMFFNAFNNKTRPLFLMQCKSFYKLVFWRRGYSW